MKSLITILVFLGSFAAKADQIIAKSEVIYGATLNKVYSEHKFMEDVENGSVQVNMTAQTITLSLQHKFSCPQDTYCAQVMPMPTIITLPITGQLVDRCGSEIFYAVVDKTPVDGLREQITVTDNTNNVCPTFVALPESSVQYSTYSPWIDQTIYSSFNGTTLRLLPTYFENLF